MRKDIIKESGPYITVLTAIAGLLIYFNTHVDNKIHSLEDAVKSGIKQSDVDRRIDEKLVPVMIEIKYLREDLSRGFNLLNAQLQMISETRAKQHRD